jgi:hypothetical protein
MGNYCCAPELTFDEQVVRMKLEQAERMSDATTDADADARPAADDVRNVITLTDYRMERLRGTDPHGRALARLRGYEARWVIAYNTLTRYLFPGSFESPRRVQDGRSPTVSPSGHHPMLF